MNQSELFRKKAFGIAKAIESMSPQERMQNPTALFGSDYNCLNELVKEAYPNLSKILPPEVDFQEYDMDQKLLSVQCYSEILAFCHQIIEILDGYPNEKA